MDLIGKTILVTGGSGSFGTAFCHHLIANQYPARLVILSRDWIKQSILNERMGHPSWMRFFIGDVRDKERLMRAFKGVDYVIHAAALKDISAAEYNPREALLTNTMGTQNVIEAAIDCGVEKVVFISTDKVVAPLNAYGITKACAEILITQGNIYGANSKTRFASVRYGNVLGSRGSVLEVFKKQRSAGMVTITDERMTRFCLSLERGVQLVLHALEEMHGGEIFIPKIPSMRIVDLAAAAAPGCGVIVTGIRPGEKLHELLICRHESRRCVEQEDHYVIYPEFQEWESPRPQGAALPDSFEYASDTNAHWLTSAELLDMIGAQ